MNQQPKTNTDVEQTNVIQGESIFTFISESNKKYSLKYQTWTDSVELFFLYSKIATS